LAAGGAAGVFADIFFDHVVEKAFVFVPVLGTTKMVYDLAQLGSDLADEVRLFSAFVLDPEAD
jgi:hypothetical protein